MPASVATLDSFTTPVRWGLRIMPCLTDIVFLLPAALLFSKMSGTKTLFADGDTGWHIRTGEWILNHGSVPVKDLFSFTKPGQPWFAWEWAWDLLFAAIHRASGLAGVGFATVLLLGAISVLLYKLVLAACENDVLSFFLTAFALCGSSIHWLARPHLFSWLFLLAFLHLLKPLQNGSKTAFFALPLVMVLWVNTHGAFFVGVALLVAVALGKGLEGLLVQGLGFAQVLRQAKPLLSCAALCAAATFVNPYTWHLHSHVFAFLSDAKLLDNIQEYQSISFHAGPAVFFEIMIVLSVAAAFWKLQQGEIAPALVSAVWIHLALLSARNIPLFMIVVAPVCGGFLQRMLLKLRPLHLIGEVFATVCEICEELKPLERAPRAHLLSGFAILLLAGLFAGGAKGFEARFAPDSFPEQAIPLIQKSSARHIFTYDQWGDYLIYRLYPAKPVFMDGRSDFFGAPFVTATQHIVGAQFDWKTRLQSFSVDMVLVKPDAPLAAVLKISPEWALRFDDGKVLVFESLLPQPGLNSSTDPNLRAISDLKMKYEAKTLERRARND